MIPHDPEAEQIVVAAMATNRQDRERILARLTSADFYVPTWRAAFAAVVELYAAGERIDVKAVERVAARHGAHVDATKLLTGMATFPDEAITTVSDLSHRRRLIAAAGKITGLASDLETPIRDAADTASELILRAEAPGTQTDELLDVDTLAVEDYEHDWLVRNLLERGDRLILTGTEGLGKSTALRSWGLALASGLHPFLFTDVPPLRVLLVDLENSRAQLARAFRELRANIDYKPGRMSISLHTAGLDVRDIRDAQRLDALVEAHKADLLIIGPLYKAYRTKRGESKNDETAAEEAAYAFDRIRARHRCAIWIEAHSPHGDGGDRAGLRPYGASLWLRWPEFGFGLKRAATTVAGRIVVDVQQWRGPRERNRGWPDRLVQGASWPWVVEG